MINDRHLYTTEDIADHYVIENVCLQYCDKYLGWGLFATCDILEGEVIYTTPTLHVSSRASVYYRLPDGQEIPIDQNFYMTKVLEKDEFGEEMYEFTWFDSFVNSSCDPNAYYREDSDETKQVVVALRSISVGEEIRVDYDTIDWVNPKPFVCQCGAGGDKCVGVKRGLRFRSESDRDRLSKISSKYVQEYNQRWYG